MKYVYEFIGTFFLVLTIGLTVVNPDGVGLLAPLAIGSILAVLVYAGGHISGAHYNPAISFAVYLRGKLSTEDLGFYWIAQLLGGLAAGLLTLYFKGGPEVEALNPDIFMTFLAEFLFTFALCFVVLNVATAKETAGNSYFGFAIGFTVLAGAYAIGAISGGALNPAVALGFTLFNVIHWSSIWIYIIANLLGGALAALVFNEAHSNWNELSNDTSR
jgi:aquaporin Z